jgi:hypothetical protein
MNDETVAAVLRGMFDVHNGDPTPRAQIKLNTGGNSASVTLDPIRLALGEDGYWLAVAADESLNRTFTGEADSATGAIIALLADRLGHDAEVRMRAEF